MPIVPRLNQLCTISTVARTASGTPTKTAIATNVPCRFFRASGNVENDKGQSISYEGKMHMGADTIVEKGYFITIDSRDYQVLRAGHTRDLKGVVFMQFLMLKLQYAG